MSTEQLERITLNPPRPINPFALYRKMGWTPHVGQVKIIDSKARNQCASCGRRFGKSDLGGHRLCTEALNTRLVKSKLLDMGKRREFWIVGPSYTDSEKEFRVVWNGLKALGFEFDKPGSYNDPVGGSMHLSLFEGLFQVHAKSERHPDSLVGEGLSGIILAEAAKMKESTWVKLLRPTLADYAGWMSATSTPEGKNWFYGLWQRGQDPLRVSWDSWRMPSWTNPHVYPNSATDEGIKLLRIALNEGAALTEELCLAFGVDPEIGELIGDLTEATFNQEIAAMFTEFAGRVFSNFDEEIHVGDYEFNPAWTQYACVDYGYVNPSVWLLLQVDPHEEQVQVLDEVYLEGLSPDELADEIMSRGLAPRTIREFFPDPASPGDTRILSKKLRLRSHNHGTGGEIKWRVDAIRKGLQYVNPKLPAGHPEKVPGLVFSRRCTRTIADMLNYRYPERKVDAKNEAPENPMKKDDHGPEALGRFYAGHFGTPESRQRRARVSKSNLAGG